MMDKVSLEQFLDTGWMHGADIFYKGMVYHTECGGKGKEFIARVTSWAARKINDVAYMDTVSPEEEPDWKVILEEVRYSEDDAREALLAAPIFEGKTFWEVEEELEWLEQIEYRPG